MPAEEFFPSDYFDARARFCAAAGEWGTQAHAISASGPQGEGLTVDSCHVGSPTPRRLVLLTSGIHGVEGYAGSALQQLWLEEFAHAIAADTAALLVHALNPYGFAFGRRANEHNVDLNRNGIRNFPGPANDGYRALDDWLNPTDPAPIVDDFCWRAVPRLLRAGYGPLVQAIAAGQYEFPRGLFYGGMQREPSLAILSDLLADPRFAGVEQVWHLDLHTGLGRYGQSQLLLDVPPGTPEFIECAQRFGAERVKSDQAAGSSPYRANGILTGLTREAFPGRRVLSATVEFGTYGLVSLLRRLRAENRSHFHGAQRAITAQRIRQALRDAAAPPDPAWRAAVVAGGRELFGRLRSALMSAWPD